MTIYYLKVFFVLGMLDAYIKIFRYEGFSGLYKGFWVSSVQIVSGNYYEHLKT